MFCPRFRTQFKALFCLICFSVSSSLLYYVTIWETGVFTWFYQLDSVVKAQRRREYFCSNIDTSFIFLEEVCQRFNPISINYSPKPLANNQLGLTPVAVIATNRPSALYRIKRSRVPLDTIPLHNDEHQDVTLHALTSADGVDPSLITVFMDGAFKGPTLLTQLFNIKAEYNLIHLITPDQIPESASFKERAHLLKERIDTHYKLSLDKLFTRLYPDANEAIILEDDLEVSPDFFSYFNQTIGLLYEDASLYCISAWNDFSFQHSSRDPSLLYRVDNMPGLGWILTRSLYEEIEPKWPTESEPLTWDAWLRLPAQRKGRECIMPDVCRTFHFATGVHINEDRQSRYFNTHSFNRHTKYHQLQTKKQASPVDHSLSLCSESLIPDTMNHTYVIYLEGSRSLTDAMRCFKLWDINFRPGHKDAWRFWHKNNHVIIIRCPESDYCKYRPEGLIFITRKPMRKTTLT